MGGRGSGGGRGNPFTLDDFREGATPKDIDINKNYTMIKITSSGNSNYGSLPGSDVKDILKGYHFNGFFWEKTGTNSIYEVKRKH